LPDKLNILFIVSDQHNAKVTGYAGHPQVKTPHLDRMAAEGVRFDVGITQNPICTPSRVSFLSGQYCHNHGYYGLSGPNPNGLPTVFGHFRRHAYTTAAIGKMHCPEYWLEDDCDHFHDTNASSIGGVSKEYKKFLEERGKFELEDHKSMPEFGSKGRQKMDSRPSPLTFDECQEGWVANKVNAIIDEAVDNDKPFFIHASFPRPHQCTTPCQEFWDLYEGVDIELPPNADHDMTGKPPHMRKSAENWRKGNWALFEPRTFEAARARKMHGYLGAVSQCDHAVGTMIEHLKARGLDQNTLVVYTADHGDYAAEFGIMEKAPGICSDAITRVPYLWWSPGRIEPGVSQQIAELVDAVPTFCAQAGLPELETADGQDLSGLLAGGDEPVHRVGVTEHPWSKSVRRGKWRMVRYPAGMFDEHPDGFGELYDLEADPYEMTNRYFDDDCQGLVAELTRELSDWLVTTTRPRTALDASGCGRPGDGEQRRVRYNNSFNADGKINPKRITSAKGTNYT